MTSTLQFDATWLQGDQGTDAERATFCELTIRADDVVLTEVVDTIARTTRNTIRVSLDPLARWFAANWWRLRWEPTPQPLSLSWRMAHEVGAAGNGFVWPRLSFDGDGTTVQIRGRTTSAEHTVRYLRDHDVSCSALTVERAVDDIMALVLARQSALNAKDEDLHDTWRAVALERADPELAAFRKREAIMGLDPGERPPEDLASLFEKGAWLGPGALNEALAETRASQGPGWLDELERLRNSALPALSFQRVLAAAHTWHSPASTSEAWRRASSYARHLRDQWSLGNEPVTDEFLADTLGSDIHSGKLSQVAAPLFIGFRDAERVRPVLRSTPHRANRRFDVARLIADAAVADAADALYPLTKSFTDRQKFQRAAAQEFLCPIAGLKERVTLPYPDDEQLADAASHFQVSELVVKNALVNRGLVDRDYLA